MDGPIYFKLTRSDLIGQETLFAVGGRNTRVDSISCHVRWCWSAEQHETETDQLPRWRDGERVTVIERKGKGMLISGFILFKAGNYLVMS